jgi:2-amino-4-hydroxy-6-hydroxymethyldihydropteridine diphosphokinase
MNTAGREAVVALGSNLGDPAAQVRAALDWLGSLADGPVRRSSLWQSTPVDCPPGSPLFVNAVAVFTPLPGETPESLLVKLQAAERGFGRQPKKVLNESRPLDLDLIAWGGERRDSLALVLPHPRAHRRRFVLEPLVELAPGLILPGQALSAIGLLAGLPPDPDFRRLA